MKVRKATRSDAPIIYSLMMQAFKTYKNETPPSTALEESLASIEEGLQKQEQALLAYIDRTPVGMIRFRLREEDVYFYRLSVLPEKQGQGIAKSLIGSVEEYASKAGKVYSRCKVRKMVAKNIALYERLGYRVYDEEHLYRDNGVKLEVVSMEKALNT
ncbi:GNAT family N-acetyltransferase [Virgibacillus sp. W0430]|uniref:GNAT family N-acetyltransferase n=1 Tax=Virgibacillus sp. W0430 TaxID=3391580 RepID=UPI003F476D91